MALIDIVIPCYRYGRYLPDCIASIASQSVSDWRAVIIDDASPDDSAEVAHRLAACDRRVQVIAHTRNQGHIATYNEGIEQASAEFFLLLSADDMLAPGALERAVTAMHQHPGVVLTYGGSVDFSDDAPVADADNEPAAWQVVSGSRFIRSLCARAVDFVPTPSVILRTTAQKAAGGYRSSLPHAGDLEMWLRVALHGGVASTPAVQSFKRVHGGNMSLRASDIILRDYVQRAAAFAAFFQGPGDTMGDAARFYRLARQRLALRACQTSLAQAVRGNRQTAAGLLRLAHRLMLAPAARGYGADHAAAFGD